MCQGLAKTCRTCRMKDADPNLTLEQPPRLWKMPHCFAIIPRISGYLTVLLLCQEFQGEYSNYPSLYIFGSFFSWCSIFLKLDFFSFMEISKFRGYTNCSDQEDSILHECFLSIHLFDVTTLICFLISTVQAVIVSASSCPTPLVSH